MKSTEMIYSVELAYSVINWGVMAINKYYLLGGSNWIFFDSVDILKENVFIFYFQYTSN